MSVFCSTEKSIIHFAPLLLLNDAKSLCLLTWEVSLAAQIIVEVPVERAFPNDELGTAHAQASEAAPCKRNVTHADATHL